MARASQPARRRPPRKAADAAAPDAQDTTGSRRARPRTVAIVLAVYTATFVTVAFVSGSTRSATMDEPTHLVAGYSILTAGDYRLDPTHPPLVRMWAALPLLAYRSAPVAQRQDRSRLQSHVARDERTLGRLA